MTKIKPLRSLLTEEGRNLTKENIIVRKCHKRRYAVDEENKEIAADEASDQIKDS